MNLSLNRSAVFASSLMALSILAISSVSAQEIPDGVWVRDGYELTVAESTINKPRFLEFDDRGTLYVSVPNNGMIQSCRDKDGDGVYESLTTYVEGYEKGKILQGMQFYKG